MQVVIIANGQINDSPAVQEAVEGADLIIAADGGARHCLALGVVPAVLVGDFDSIGPDAFHALEAKGTKIVRHPMRKDQTDLELAIEYAVQEGGVKIIILGGIGTRWDQSLANYLLPVATASSEVRIQIVDGYQSAQLLRSGESLFIPGQPGDTLSLVPIAGDAIGVTTTGLEYPLIEGTLRFGSTLGISNILLGDRATVSLQEGLLLCFVIHGPVENIEKVTT
jgi:thiamine pyrophosphokinase